MARLFTLGFEDQMEFNLGIVSSEANVRPSYHKLTSGTGLDGRISTGVLSLDTGNGPYWFLQLEGNPAEVYFVGTMRSNSPTAGYYPVKFTNVAWNGDGSYSGILYNSGGSISLTRNSTVLATSAAGVISANTVHVIEARMKPLNSGGVFTVKVDGVEVVTYSGDTTASLETVNGIQLLGIHNGGDKWTWWDNVAINDTSGSNNNSWIGMMKLEALRVTGAGNNSDLTRVGTDLGTNFAQVRDMDSGMLHGLQGALDEYDLFAVDVPDLPVGATINNIVVQVSGKSTSGAGEIAQMVRANTTDDTAATDAVLTTGGIVRQYAWPLNPADSAAWEEADLSNLQIGVKIRT